MKKMVFSKSMAWLLSIAMVFGVLLVKNTTVNAGTERIQITYDGQIVDSFNGVNAVYTTYNTDSGEYSCAGYVHRYYSSVYGVTVSNLFKGATPNASSGSFSVTSSPEVGDIGYQTSPSSGSGHWFIIKEVNGDGSYTIIEQNWKWVSNGAIYCNKDRIVSYSDTPNFKVFRWSEKPGRRTSPTIKGVYISNKSAIGYRLCFEVDNPSDVSSAKVATWASSDQSDLIWHDCNYNGAGTYFIDLNRQDYKAGVSYYINHAYVYGYYGSYDSVEIGVGYDAPQISGTYISNMTATGFRVCFEVKDPSVVLSASVATWTKSDQSDLKWHNCNYNGAGTYFVDLNRVDYQSGAYYYINHAYIYDYNGKYDSKEIVAEYHNYTEKVVSPTCTTDGYTLHTCSYCGKSYKDTITKAIGHSYTTKVVAPTCTDQGYTLHTCSKCGNNYKDTYTNALGHDYKLTSEKAATCTADGQKTYKCSRCGDTKTETVKATGHSYTTKVVAPTCTDQGYTLHTCTNCGNNYKDTYTNALGHDYKLTSEKAATCTADGQKTYKCSRCGDTKTETIKATGHSYTTKVVAPTCTDQGYTVHTCSKCGDSYKDSYVDALGHDYEETVIAPTETEKGYTLHTCKRCGDSYKDNYTEPVPVHLAGDINNDGKVNMKDVTRLHQYINGWDVSVVEEALDVNGDGKVNMKDVTRLHQYINGWDVKIFVK